MKSFWRARIALFAVLSSFAAPVQAAAPPPLDAFGNLPGIEDMSISPSGSRIAIVGDVEGKRHLLALGPNDKVLVNAPLDQTKLRYIKWIGEDSILVVTSATENLGIGFTTDKHEFYQAYVVPTDGSKPYIVFSKSPALVKSIFGNHGARFVDGKWLGYFGGIVLALGPDGIHYYFDNGRPALFAVDLKDNKPQKIAPSATEGRDRDWLVDGAGKVGAILDIASSDGSWKIIDGRRKVLVSGIDPTGGVDLICFGRDGTSVIYSRQDKEAELTRWFELPLAGGAPVEIFADVAIDHPYIDSANGRLLGYLERGAPPKPVLFDPGQQAVFAKVYRAFPKLNLEIRDWTPDFKHILVKTSGNEDSGSWYTVDMTKGAADVVGIERPLIYPEQVGPISTVAYQAGDGLKLDGILTLPPGRAPKNLPVIMFPHGGPHSHDKVQFDWWAQAFASRGYAVFQPNFRGSTNRDDAFRIAGRGEWGRKMQTDISDGLAELAKQGIVDPKRACIVGASYGGYAALAGVTLQSGLYRCAVAVAGVSDLSDMYWTDYRESGDDKMVIRQLKESLGEPSSFAAVSPRKHAKQASAPILLIHGKDDTRVPLRQSAAMANALKDAGKPHEFVVMPGEDHFLSKAATRKQMLEATMRFVLQHNPAE